MATKKKDKETLGQRLSYLRKERGVTQVELAEKLGVGQPNLSDYERDIYRPNADMLLKIVEVLDISADDLLGRKYKPDEPAVSRSIMRRVLKMQMLSRRDQQALLRTIDAFLSKSA